MPAEHPATGLARVLSTVREWERQSTDVTGLSVVARTAMYSAWSYSFMVSTARALLTLLSAAAEAVAFDNLRA